MPASRLYSPSGGSGGISPPPDLSNVDEIRTLSFSFDSPSPLTIFNIPAGAKIISAKISITTAFDIFSNARLKIGDAGLVDRLMTIDENVPTILGDNEAHHPYVYPADTDIILTITPGTTTNGAGYAVVIYNLNN